MKPWFVYILRCGDGSLYTGISTDVARRAAQHDAGQGGNYTRSHRPVRLLQAEPFPTRSAALKREAEIKRWSKKKKERLLTAGSANTPPAGLAAARRPADRP